MNGPWRAAAKQQAGKQQNVHEGKERQDDPEVEHEVLIEGGAMARGVNRQMPEALAAAKRRRRKHPFIVGRRCW